MALNMDAVLRIVAKVQGGNEFKQLTDTLESVGTASKNSGTGLQQLAAESGRLTQEAAKSTGSVRAQATALQELQARTRATATDLNRAGNEAKGLGASFADLRGRSSGVLDGFTASLSRGANNIREFKGALQLTDGQLSQVRDQVLALGNASKTTERALDQQVAALKNIRSQAEVNGRLYNKLTGDIERLQAASKGLSGSSDATGSSLKKLAASSVETTGSIRQQIQALTALQGGLKSAGADVGATGQQLDVLKRKAAEMGQAWEPGIRGLKLLAQASAESTTQQANNMTRLQGVLSKAGEGYQRLGREIDNLRQKAAGLDLSKGLNITPGAVVSGVGGAVRNIVQMRQDLSRSMTGRVVLTGEGLAAAGVAGAAGAGAASGLGGMAGGAQAVAASLDAIAAKAAALPGVLKPLGGLLSEPASAAAAGVGQWASALTAAQGKLQALATPFEAIGTAIASIGPETAAVAGVASLAIAGVYQVLKRQADEAQADLEQSFKGISDSAQKVLQDLVRIYDKVPNARLEAQQGLRDRNMQRLGEVPADSTEARRAANAVAAAEREIAKIQEERNALLDGARQRQNQATEALRVQIQVARDRLTAQQQLTAETLKTAQAEREARAIAGSIRRNQERVARDEERSRPQREAEQAAADRMQEMVNVARQRLELQRQLTEEQRRTTAQLAEEQAIRGAIRRNQERVERERARAEQEQADLRRRAAAAFAPSATLALPAAGQTTFRGAVNAQGMGGGARSLSNFEVAGTRDAIGAPMPGFSGAARTALNEQAAATDRARGALSELFVEIDKATAASNGSVASLQRQRTAWEALRVAVNPAAPAYEKARFKVQELDGQLRKLSATQEQISRRGIGREAVGGALGALATGGGLQSAVGSLAGSLAFSGGAAGLAAAAGVTVVAGAGALAVRTGTEAESARVRLKALTDQFGEYNAAQTAAARIAQTLRISQTEAEDSFSKLYAALRPTGVTLKEVEDAFIGYTAAARASGSTAAEASAALLQLKQALGSGVLQGDELRSIREQAPAAAQAIAKEMGVSVGELKKLGSEGKITTDIVLRALARLKGEKLDQLKAQFDTSTQAIKDFQIAVEQLGVKISRVFGPAAVASLRAFTGLLERTADLLGGDFAEKQSLRQRARDMAGQQSRERFGLFGGGKAAEFFAQQEQKNYERLLAEREARLARERGTDAPSTSQQAARDAAASDRAKAAARAQDEATKKQREDQQKLFEDELKIRQDAEKRLADASQQYQEQVADFRLQTIRRAADLERQLGDQRLSIEREIAASRLAATRAQEDLALSLEIQQRRQAGLGVDGLEEAKATRDLFRQFEDQIQQSRQTALDRQLTLQRQLEQFKVETADGIGKIQTAYAKSVSAILQDAAEKMAEKMEEGARNAAEALNAGGSGSGGGGGGASIANIADGSLNANARAWLAAIRAAEGTAGPNGYRTMFGGGTFSDMSRHPDRVIRSGGYTSAAAGAYQFMPDTWRSVGGGAMTPERQDRAALALALRRGVDLSRAPFTRENVAKLAPEWASLPTLRGGSFYGQPSWSFNSLARVFGQVAPMAPMLPPAPGGQRPPALGANLGSQEVARANQNLQRTSQELAKRQREAEASSRRSSFMALASGLDQRVSGATSELDGQARSAREKLEDESRYALLLKEGIAPELAKQRIEMDRIATKERDRLDGIREEIERKIESGQLSEEERKILQGQLDIINTRLAAQPAILAGIENEIDATNRLRKAREDAEGKDIGKGLRDGVKGYLESIGTLAEGVQQVTGNALSGLEDQLVEFVATGKASFNELAASILKDMSRVLIQQMVLKPLLGGLFPGITANATGNIYATTGLVPFANGGIVNSPTLFKFASGGGFNTGLMGEDGPEAIVPLRRGKDGKLGIVSTGGGSTSVVVNVNMQTGGSDVNASSGDGQLLGKALSEAVQAELIRQKRPGGILYA